LILWVDIQLKVLYFQEFTPGRGKKVSKHPDRLPAQDFEAVLDVMVTWAKDTIFAKFHQEV